MRREKWKALVMHKMITEVTPGYRPRIFTYGAYTHLKQSLYCSGACLWDKCQKKIKEKLVLLEQFNELSRRHIEIRAIMQHNCKRFGLIIFLLNQGFSVYN